MSMGLISFFNRIILEMVSADYKNVINHKIPTIFDVTQIIFNFEMLIITSAYRQITTNYG